MRSWDEKEVIPHSKLKSAQSIPTQVVYCVVCEDHDTHHLVNLCSILLDVSWFYHLVTNAVNQKFPFVFIFGDCSKIWFAFLEFVTIAHAKYVRLYHNSAAILVPRKIYKNLLVHLPAISRFWKMVYPSLIPFISSNFHCSCYVFFVCYPRTCELFQKKNYKFKT